MSKLQNDRTPFWGSKLSPELKYLQTIITNKNDSVKLDRNSFRELLKSIFAFLINYILIFNNKCGLF
jgi:hypothetical protein